MTLRPGARRGTAAFPPTGARGAVAARLRLLQAPTAARREAVVGDPDLPDAVPRTQRLDRRRERRRPLDVCVMPVSSVSAVTGRVVDVGGVPRERLGHHRRTIALRPSPARTRPSTARGPALSSRRRSTSSTGSVGSTRASRPHGTLCALMAAAVRASPGTARARGGFARTGTGVLMDLR